MQYNVVFDIIVDVKVGDNMKKRFVLVLFVILSLFLNVHALKSNDTNLTGRKECEHFELAKANSDGSLEKQNCFDNYVDAKNKMNEESNNTLVILERSNNVTKIIDAKYALAYLDKNDARHTTNIYTSSTLGTKKTYMNNYRDYGATDAAFLELNYSNKAIKIRIGGVTGWIKSGEYTLIPITWVKTASFYQVTDNAILHYYAKNIEEDYIQNYRSLGPKPTFLNNGNYRSYDFIYFYNDYTSMIDDYREGSSARSVNKDNPYYNYYLYLPHRSKTNYSIDDFDSYIRNVLNMKGSLYGKDNSLSNYSALYGTSEYFLYSEKMYGANALSVFSLSRNESANGRSSIAAQKNNIFGHDAIDSAPYSNASGYLDIRSSIYTHGYGYINYGYAEVADWRYNGDHFGNKNTGMNVEYASDVYWGEKAANYMYLFDRDNGLLDYNHYQLVLSKTGDVNARTAPNTSSKVVYSIKCKDLPFILLEEVEGEDIKGNNIWYKLQSDSNVDDKGNIISSNSSWPEYNWNGVIYVHSSYFMKINEVKSTNKKYPTPTDITKDTVGTIKTYANNSSYTPIVGKVINNKNTYYSSTLTEKNGLVLKDSLVVILEEIKDTTTKYHIISDFSTNQKAWIDASDIEIINKDLLCVSISDTLGYINVLDVPGGNSIYKVFNGNYLPIVGKEEKNGKVYLKVEYQIQNKLAYGYVDSSIANISYTLKYLNIAPIIEAMDTTVIINNEFNPMANVTGKDAEDGNITNKIKIIKNNVDTTKVGSYEVIYSLTDSFGETVEKTIMVSVIKLETSDALFMYDSLKHVSDNTFTFSGFIGIKGMDNKNVLSTLIFENEKTKEIYTYNLSKWNEYPYEMSSLDDDKTYDYSGGWFKSNLNLTDLPNGDYKVYVKVINGKKEAKALFTNIAYQDMTRRVKGKNKEFSIDVDYTTLNSPLHFMVRDSLISLDEPKTTDPMYNFFNEIKLDNNILNIKGTSHNVGVSLGEKDNVTRKIVFENKDNYERYEMDLGSITNGDYPITLAVSDNLDKTKAWFNNKVDLDSLPTGSYVIYIKNTVNNVTYYGELIDVSYTDFTSINNEHYLLSRNDDLRLRMELIKK